MKTAAFFDMDSALLEGASQFAFLGWCLGRRLAPPLNRLCTASGFCGAALGSLLDAMRVRTSGFAFLGNTSVDCLERRCAEFFDAVLVYRLRRQAAALVEAHRERGHLTVLVSSVCEPLARPVAACLRVDALIATQLLASGGRYVSTRQWPEPRGRGKRQLVAQFCEEKGISPLYSFAYTGHHSDRPLLEFIGHPSATNPSRRLRRIAESKGWRVVDLDA